MFTGLIEEIGSVLGIRATDRGTQLQLCAPRIADTVHTGDSISVNGCCLTVASHRHEEIVFDLLEETVARTNLGALKRDSTVRVTSIVLPASSPLRNRILALRSRCRKIERSMWQKRDQSQSTGSV